MKTTTKTISTPRPSATDSVLYERVAKRSAALSPLLDGLHKKVEQVQKLAAHCGQCNLAGGDLEKAGRHLYAVHETMKMAEHSLGNLLTPVIVDPLRGLADSIAKASATLSPQQVRQLNTLVRKRLGYADPKPEPLVDVDQQVTQAAEDIVRAAAMADIQKAHTVGAVNIQKIHGGPRG